MMVDYDVTTTPDHKKRNSVSGALVLFVMLIFCQFFWQDTLDPPLTDVLFHVRGERSLAEELLYVYISDDDIAAVGGWPITRDFFGYMTYVLDELGAKTIALDFLFADLDPLFPEYDRALSDFFESTQKVCLPMLFQDMGEHSRQINAPALPSGADPIYPMSSFRMHAAGVGFSNLGDAGTLRSIPVAISDNGQTVLSFGAEIARVYLGYPDFRVEDDALIFNGGGLPEWTVPLDAGGKLRLNHFGKMEQATHIGFFELLKNYESQPDSMRQLISGKLVIVAASSAALPILKSTPYSHVFPAALIHATVADNIIRQKALRPLPSWLQITTIALMAVLPVVVLRRSVNMKHVSVLAILLLAYWLKAAFMFVQVELVLPLFFPTFALIAAAIWQGLQIHTEQQQHVASRQVALTQKMQQNVISLQETEQQLAEIEKKLQQSRQLHAAASDESKRLAAERRVALEKVESLLQDMHPYQAVKKGSADPENHGIVYAGDSPMQAVLELVRKVSVEDIAVLVLGETGTGKELIARAIHANSHRRGHDFIAVNCGALPEHLLESELFGHEKGAFTGAQARRRGRFELADRGTLFLDEITETSAAFQVKLLRILQEGTFERLGGEETLRTDVRIICACNVDLKRTVDEGQFRSDLYYRLNGFTIHLPPLRDRESDVAELAENFLQKYGYVSITISKQAMIQLKRYSWPGNVRELENAIRRAAILAQSEERTLIQQQDLSAEILHAKDESGAVLYYEPLEQQILNSLRNLHFSRSAITETAKALGNRDRGTITEYFRGLCFDALVQAKFNSALAAQQIAGTSDQEIVHRVQNKMQQYLSNLQQACSSGTESTAYKGLPKQYHASLASVLQQVKAVDK